MAGRWVHEKGAPWPVWVDDNVAPIRPEDVKIVGFVELSELMRRATDHLDELDDE